MSFNFSLTKIGWPLLATFVSDDLFLHTLSHTFDHFVQLKNFFLAHEIRHADTCQAESDLHDLRRHGIGAWLTQKSCGEVNQFGRNISANLSLKLSDYRQRYA